MAKTYQLKADQGERYSVDEVVVEVTEPQPSVTREKTLKHIDGEIVNVQSAITSLQAKLTALQADRTAIDTEANKKQLAAKG